MVTLEVGVIAFLASTYLGRGEQIPLWGKLVALCFGLSVFTATYHLSALPWVVLFVNTGDDWNVYQKPITTAWGLEHVRVWMVAVAQHFFFIAGLVVSV